MVENILKILIFIPTYNEKDNVIPIYDAIRGLNKAVDILFLDDNSPDGTGKIIDQLSKKDNKVFTIHRTGKLGLGTAHKEGFKFAQKHDYDFLLTMDADFTHDPKYIPELLAQKDNYDIVIGSRYTEKADMSSWSISRKFVTYTAHFLTKYGLGMPFDCTGAFRLYNKKMIKKLNEVAYKIGSKGFSFMFESLFYLKQAGAKIGEVPITAFERIRGDTKISQQEMINGFLTMIKLIFKRFFGFCCCKK